MSMYMRTLGAVVVLLGVLGCAAPVAYDHPTKPLADKQRDYVECLAITSQAASGAGGWSSDRAIRSAVFDNARDRYLAMCLESRGWGPGGRPTDPFAHVVSAPPPKDAERRCQQEALFQLGYYDLWRDGRDSFWWQQALQRYQTTNGLTPEDPETPARLRTALDEDLQAAGRADGWRQCLQGLGKPM
jgi:hypothetical protein